MTIDLDAPTSAVPMSDARTVSGAVQPIIPGYYPDPSICRVGGEYLLVNSSFEYTPGVPVWRSTDLTTWEQVGNALSRDDQFAAGSARASGGIYAPTIRHHDDRFWIITTDVSGEPGQLVVSAPSAEGPWSPATIIPGLRGIDPDLAWDDDGSCLVSYCSSDPAHPGIVQVQVDLERGVALETPRPLWQGTGLAYPEGPHLFRRDGWWYLLIAEGGTERGHAISIARSRSARGPFESAPANPIFSRRSTPFPTQNTGHSDIVELEDGSWAMVYLGVRPRGTTPLFHVNGRETFLARIDWVDGWPVVDPDGFSVPIGGTGVVDRFDHGTLHPRWVSPGAGLRTFTQVLPDGGVELREAPADNGAHALLSLRARDPHWRFEADVRRPAAVALRLRMDEAHWYELRVSLDTVEVVASIGPLVQVVATAPIPDSPSMRLIVETCTATSNGPDDVRFAVSSAEGEHELARLDGRYLSTEVAGGFTGRTIGLRALPGGRPVISEARYTPST